MTAQELIDELIELVKKHGDCEVYASGYEVLDVEYDAEDETIEINP